MRQFLQQKFYAKDSNNLKYFLATEVARSLQGNSLSPKKHVLDFLGEKGTLGPEPANSLMDPNSKLDSENKDLSMMQVDTGG